MVCFLPIESRLRRQGYSLIAGIDEVGRGPLAGPVVSAAVILKEDAHIPGLNDSKLLSHARRLELFDIILDNCLDYAIAAVSHINIDRVNILNCVRMANDLCVRALKEKPDLVLIDGRDRQIIKRPFCTMIKGESKSPSIAAASILAKVTRDAIMCRYAREFPSYHFDRHKGYGTRAHQSLILKHGVCELHRKTFIHLDNLTA